jgi:hypothetical protein
MTFFIYIISWIAGASAIYIGADSLKPLKCSLILFSQLMRGEDNTYYPSQRTCGKCTPDQIEKMKKAAREEHIRQSRKSLILLFIIVIFYHAIGLVLALLPTYLTLYK